MSVDELAGASLASWFERRSTESPRVAPYRVREGGGWREVSWLQMREMVEPLAVGLRRLGLGAGDRFAMMGAPTLEWIACELACQSIGAIFCAVYAGAGPEPLAHVLRSADPEAFLVDRPEHLEALFAAEALGDEPLVPHLLVTGAATTSVGDPRIRALEAVSAEGARGLADGDEPLAAMAAARSAEEILRLCYTSGTTGPPKGAMLSSRNLIWAWAELFDALGLDLGPADRTLTLLPPAQVTQAAFSIVVPLLYGCTAYIDPAMTDETLAEVNPTIMFLPARTGDQRATELNAAIEGFRPSRRAIYRGCIATRVRVLEDEWAGAAIGPVWRLRDALATRVLPRELVRRIGLGSVRFVYTGGAPIAPDLTRVLHAWGVRVMEIYGSTEIGGLATIQPGVIRPGVVGVPVGRLELRLAEDGEILLRSPGLFRGYWRDSEASARAIDDEGWFHTGDIGERVSGGDLAVVDRRTDFVTLASGEAIAASAAENLVKTDPCVREAILVGEGRPYLTALVELEPAPSERLAGGPGESPGTFAELAASVAVRARLEQIRTEVNPRLEARGIPRIRDIRALPRPLDPSAGDEITPTGKVRRRSVAAKFEDLSDRMYET
jgi:long-chain acyl-CoA synthetase